MAWYKGILSGSNARLASLQLDTALAAIYGGTGLTAASASGFLVGTNSTTYTTVGSNGSGQVVRTTGAVGLIASGSFSGSFVGSGAGLTGVTADSTFTVSGSQGGFSFQTATDSLLFNTASSHGFDLSSSFSGTNKRIQLVTPQALRTTDTPTFGGLISGPITGSTLRLTAMNAGTSNNVVIVGTNDFLVSRSIDTRVWGTSLIDGAGSNTRVAFYTDADSISSDAAFTFGSSILTVNGSTFGSDVVIAGNLTVQGTTTIINVDNLAIQDRFILLNSGSASGDGGFIIQSGSATSFDGVAFGWDDSAARWGVQQNIRLTQSSSVMIPEAYVTVVIDVDGGQTDDDMYQKTGNVMVSGSEVYFWVP